MQRLREKYGEYLVWHQRSGMKLSPIAFSEVDAWHNELDRIKGTPKTQWDSLDNNELRRESPHG